MTLFMLCGVVAFGLANGQDLDRPRYGSASDLRGLTRLFVDTGADVRARDRIIRELRSSGIVLELVQDARDAQILLEFGASVERRVSGWVTNTRRDKDKRREESVTTPTAQKIHAGAGTRLEFILRYAEDSGRRLATLRQTKESWWEDDVRFFDVPRSRAWIVTRRIAHTSHHRGQLMAMLRMIGHDVHSNYGPTADTGGLMQHHAPTIYAYPSLKTLLESEAAGGAKAALPGASDQPVTERPDAPGAFQDVSRRNADLTSKSHRSSH